VTESVRPQTAVIVRGRQGKQERRIFVLDTNVLMHDPTAIFRFEEHDVYIPMTVLEELDAGKKGLSESARNVRQVSRFLDELMRDATKKDIDRGLSLPTAVPINHGKRPPAGRLYFQTRLLESVLPDSLPGQGADNAILANTLALQQNFPAARVTLVSKDINLRIKAAIVGVHAEDYSSDKTIEDADLLVSGVQQLPANFWEKHGKGMESWQQQSRTFYRVRGPLVRVSKPSEAGAVGMWLSPDGADRTPLPGAVLREFRFRAVRPSFDTHPFTLNGTRSGNKLQLWTADEDQQLCVTASARLA